MIKCTVNQMIWERMQQDNQNRALRAKNLAEQSNPIGLYEMGIRYLHGWGVNPSFEDAYKYLDSAAIHGHAGASYELARQYMQGNELRNIHVDLDKAEKYINYSKNNNTEKFNTPNYNQQQVIEELSNLEKVIHAIRSMNKAALHI